MSNVWWNPKEVGGRHPACGRLKDAVYRLAFDGIQPVAITQNPSDLQHLCFYTTIPMGLFYHNPRAFSMDAETRYHRQC